MESRLCHVLPDYEQICRTVFGLHISSSVNSARGRVFQIENVVFYLSCFISATAFFLSNFVSLQVVILLPICIHVFSNTEHDK